MARLTWCRSSSVSGGRVRGDRPWLDGRDERGEQFVEVDADDSGESGSPRPFGLMSLSSNGRRRGGSGRRSKCISRMHEYPRIDKDSDVYIFLIRVTASKTKRTS